MKLANILSADRVEIGVALASKKSVLERLAALLAAGDATLNANAVFDSLLARERLGTTGLGAGIAIPHGRVSNNGSVLGAFVRTREPIQFDAVDNAPVDLFFALCVPEEATEEHLDLLAELAQRFSDAEFVERLRGTTDAAVAYEQLAEGLADAAAG